MIRQALVALALTSVIGCSSSSNMNPFAAHRQEEAQLAAYAAKTPYPSQTKAEVSHQAAALISPKNDDIKIINFSDHPMRDVNVWVNGTYLYRVDVIPSQSTRTVKPAELYDTSGRTMASLKTTPNRVELQAGNKLWTLQTASGQ